MLPVIIAGKLLLKPATDWFARVPFRAVANLVARDLRRHCSVRPVHRPDPVERQKHLFPRPPVPRVHSQVADFPGFIINEEVFNVAEMAVARLYPVASHFSGAAEVNILMVSRRLMMPVPFVHLLLRCAVVGSPSELNTG